jgi:hypothetical protein
VWMHFVGRVKVCGLERGSRARWGREVGDEVVELGLGVCIGGGDWVGVVWEVGAGAGAGGGSGGGSIGEVTCVGF